MLILGLDPGLRATGWGLIQSSGTKITHIANGVVRVPNDKELSSRLSDLFSSLSEVIDNYSPNYAAVEEVFLNKNPASSLKLGQARGVVLLSAARNGIPVTEYSATKIKKSIVGSGHADKTQMRKMVTHLLPSSKIIGHDAVDALAVAICHSHYQSYNDKIAKQINSGA